MYLQHIWTCAAPVKNKLNHTDCQNTPTRMQLEYNKALCFCEPTHFENQATDAAISINFKS